VPWRRVAGLSFEVDVTQERNKIDQRLLRSSAQLILPC